MKCERGSSFTISMTRYGVARCKLHEVVSSADRYRVMIGGVFVAMHGWQVKGLVEKGAIKHWYLQPSECQDGTHTAYLFPRRDREF